MTGDRLKRIGTWVAFGVLFFLYQYFDVAESGSMIMIGIMYFLGLGIAWLMKKKVREEFTPLLIPFALHVSMAILLLASGILLSVIGFVLFDVIVLAIGSAWLFTRPGKGPVVLLTLYHVFAMAMQGFMMFAAASAAGGTVNLALNLIYRAFMIYLMLASLKEYQEAQALLLTNFPAEETAEELGQ